MFCMGYFRLYEHITSLTESFRMVHVNQCLVDSESKKTKRNLVSQYFTKSVSSSDATESESQMSVSPLSSGSVKKIKTKKWQSVPQRQNPSARIPHTLFLRDFFRSGCSVFFSHFHTDHMQGLTKKFIGDIFGMFCDDYCYNQATPTTCNLVANKFQIDRHHLHPLRIGEHYYLTNCKTQHIPAVMEWIHREDPSYPLSSTSLILNENVSDSTLQTRLVRVDVIDANHCPGSCMFLFSLFDWNETTDPHKPSFHLFYRVLYTGDFRFESRMLDDGILRRFSDNRGESLDLLMVDNTYNNEAYNFPRQQCVVNTAAWVLDRFWREELHRGSDLVVLIESYSVGKENLWLHLAKTFDLPVFMDA